MSNILSKSISTIKNWWLFLLSGIVLIVGGFYVSFTPQESYLTLAWVFSILVFINGFSNIVFSISNRKYIPGWGWYLTGGVFEILTGIILISYPEITIVLLPIFIGFWLLFRGINIIGTSLDLKNLGVLDWGWFLIYGVSLTVVSSIMILLPIIGYFTVVYLTAVGLFIFGFANISLSLKLRKLKSLTIDSVPDFENKVKSEYNNLKEEILKSYTDLSEENKNKINEVFENYESKK